MLTNSQKPLYAICALEHFRARGGSLNRKRPRAAGITHSGFFRARVIPVMGDRAGGAARLAGTLSRSSNSCSVAHQFGSWRAVRYPNLRKHMTIPSLGVHASLRKTNQTPFYLGEGLSSLFSVNPDIPIDNAINEASCLLASAIGVLLELADTCDCHLLWASFYLVESAKAVVDATASNLIKQETTHE